MIVLVTLATLVLLSVGDGKRQIIDLTHTVENGRTVTYPGYPEFNFTALIKGRQEGGFWLESGWFAISEHAGTHIDAPAHFIENGLHLQEIPLENLMGSGVVIDIKERASRDSDAQMEMSDVQKWEEKHGTIPPGAFVLMNSGWAGKYPNKTAIFGTPHHNDRYSRRFHHPGVSKDVCRWLVNERQINALGVDTPSPDFGQAMFYDAHDIIHGDGKVILENVANLDNLPASGSTIYAMPVKLHDGSGGPLRLFAIVDDKVDMDGGALRISFSLTTCLCVGLIVVPVLQKNFQNSI